VIRFNQNPRLSDSVELVPRDEISRRYERLVQILLFIISFTQIVPLVKSILGLSDMNSIFGFFDESGAYASELNAWLVTGAIAMLFAFVAWLVTGGVAMASPFLAWFRSRGQ
jgi:hypothetical protein